MVINIINLYEYREMLEIINIIVIFSIPLISIILYEVNKSQVRILETIIYIIELFIYILCNEYIMQGIIGIFTILFLLKITIILTIKKDMKVDSLSYKFIVILSLIYILNVKFEYNILINILFNIIVLKHSIINHMKVLNKELLYNKSDLNMKKINKLEIESKIQSEEIIQKNYKDEIMDISKKINNSINKSDIPIFILNINKEFIYSNEAFNEMIKDYSSNTFEIIEYLKFKFPKYSEIINYIKKSTKEYYNGINIESYDKKVYRIECTTDTIDESPVIICILKDITQTTLIQHSLEESEQIYKNLMDVLNEGVIIHNNDEIQYINDKALEIFGVNNDGKTMKIDNIKKTVMKNFRGRFISNFQNVINRDKEKMISKIELINEKIIELITTSINLGNEELLLSIVIDITELENTIMNIEQSEKTYKLLLQELPEGIVIINQKTNEQIYRNEASMRILKNIGVDSLKSSVKKYLNEGTYGEFKRYTVDKLNNIDISLAIVNREEDGSMIVIFRMLDYEFKTIQLEKELDIINSKNKFKTEFLSNIAYDIKKPVSTIFEMNNALIKNKEAYNTENINNNTKLIKQNCYRLIKLLNNIEDVSNIENGTCNLQLRKCDIVKLIENIVNISKSYTDRKKIEISFKTEVNKKMLALDIETVEKIILNILSNAIKFTDEGGKIEINLYIKNNQVCISIKDTGIGIPKDKTEIIFENFEQLDTTLSRGSEGTGMGLSVVKKLADLNNIKINVESELNCGSKFEIVLPNNTISKNIKPQDKFTQAEKVEMEFSDIYFNLT